MGDREKRKAQEKNEKILLELSKDPKNSFCADCKLKGPRWASTNLGVFLCMPCAGLHRKMGTHISKVKSLTLDTWTEEQLNHFMQWGNEKANALYNPHPENHPVPVGESDMEQYIRDKYERKRFQEGRSKPTAPPRDSSRQGNSGTYESVAALNTLREMGWTDEQKNRDILKQAKGDVNAAIEILCTLPPSSNHQRRPSADPRMQQLQSMGFTDQAKNNAVLQQCNGSVERAIEVLVAERRKTQASPTQSDLFANSTFESAPAQSGQQGFSLAPPAKQNAPSQQQNRQAQPQSNSQANAPAPSGLDLLGDVFGGQDPFMANKKQEDAFGAGATQQPNKSNKDSIMSLFGSAQPTPAMGMGGTGFSNPMMMGGGGFSPQQLQQQQKQQAAMQNFMGNGMMGANAGFMQQQQPYQQQMNPFQAQKQQNNMYGNGQMQGAGGFNPSAGQMGGGFAGMQHPNMQQQNYLAVSNQESSSNPFGSPNLMHGNSVFNQNAAQVPRQLTAPFGSTMSSGLQPQQQQQQSNPNNAAFASLNPFAATGSSGVKKNANPFA